LFTSQTDLLNNLGNPAGYVFEFMRLGFNGTTGPYQTLYQDLGPTIPNSVLRNFMPSPNIQVENKVLSPDNVHDSVNAITSATEIGVCEYSP